MNSGSRKVFVMTVALVGAGLLMLGGPATAAVDVAFDEQGDAAMFPMGCDFVAEPCGQPDPTNRAGDILKLRTSYRHDALVLSTSLRSLPAARRATLHVSWDIRTSGIEGQRVRRNFVVGLSLRNSRLVPASTIGTNCILANAVPKLVRRTVSIRIPAECLDRPRWVRTAGDAHYEERPEAFWRDDARAPRELYYPQSHKPTFGHRVPRG
jgi:hypothetical protein